MAKTIQNVREDIEPQRAYEFEFELLGSTTSGNEELLVQRVNSLTIPSTENETIVINYKSQQTIHVGRDSSAHTFTVSFRDGIDAAIYKFFKNWKENGLNSMNTGAGFNRDVYAAEANIRLMENDSETVTVTHNFTKVFPTSIGDMSLDYSSSEVATFDVTFSYDVHNVE